MHQTPGDDTISDEDLMQGIVACEHRALDHLYTRYRLLFRNIVSQILHNEGDSEETLQDVFVEIWKHASNFDPAKGKALGWMICLARRRAFDHYRRVHRRAVRSEKLQDILEGGQGIAPSELSGVVDYDDEPAIRDLRRALTGMIDGLPCEQKNVVYLTYFQDLSQRQIAASTGIPLGTIKTRLQLAISKLSQRSMNLREDLAQR